MHKKQTVTSRVGNKCHQIMAYGEKMAECLPAPLTGRRSRRESIDLPPFMAHCEGPHMSENLQCSICLEVFNNPVTTPCGHNFCKTCLEEFWDISQNCRCPYCKETFLQRPDLKFNVVLKAIVQLFEKDTKGLSSAGGPLSEELQCSICLEVFNDPVTTPCGHNFCKTCLKKCWDISQDCTCPFCKQMFNKRPDLKSNTGLREIVQVFGETTGYKRETEMIEHSPPLETVEQDEMLVKPVMASSGSILTEDLQCSICLDLFNNPVTVPCGHSFCKTCLREFWEISQVYDCPCCKENYNERPDLREIMHRQSEILVYLGPETKLNPPEIVLNVKQVIMSELVENINHNICQKHERNLELCSRDDQTSVCPFCTEEDHKTYNPLPVEEKSAEEHDSAGEITHTTVQHIIQDTMKKMKEVKPSVKLVKKHKEEEKAKGIELCTDLNPSFERCQKPLPERWVKTTVKFLPQDLSSSWIYRMSPVLM